MTCRTEPASQLMLMATAGRLGRSFCLLHLWRVRLLCFSLIMAGWVGTRSGLHNPGSVFWHFCAVVFTEVIPSTGCVPGRQMSRQCLVTSGIRELTTSRESLFFNGHSHLRTLIGPHGFPPLCVALPSGPAWRKHGAGCLCASSPGL